MYDINCNAAAWSTVFTKAQLLTPKRVQTTTKSIASIAPFRLQKAHQAAGCQLLFSGMLCRINVVMAETAVQHRSGAGTRSKLPSTDHVVSQRA